MKASRTSSHYFISAGVFLASFSYLYLFRRLGWYMQDEGGLYYHYLRTYEGQLPYRDFYTGYGPLVYYLQAFVFDHFSVSISAVRILLAITNSTTALVLFLIARRVAPLGFALLPPLLLITMQSGDITDMVFQNSPYPSWFALAFYVLGTWTLIRSTESRASACRSGWLVATGALAALALLSKQNTGIFLLWAVSGFLFSCPSGQKGQGKEAGVEPVFLRILRRGYIALIPIAAVVLIHKCLSLLTLALFVAPTVVLGTLAARVRFTLDDWRSLTRSTLLVGAGFLATSVPWLVYFGQRMGYLDFLQHLFLIGQNVEQNLFVPLPEPHLITIVVLGSAVLVLLLSSRSRQFPGNKAVARDSQLSRRSLLLILLAAAGLLLALYASRSAVLINLLHMGIGLGEIYLAVSNILDNLAAYATALTLGAVLIVAWRQASGRVREEDPPPLMFACVAWSAACAYILYFPRMDPSHLYFGALPMLSVAGVALLPRARRRIVEATSLVSPRTVRLLFNLGCVAFFGFVIASRTTPKIYSRVSLEQTPNGPRLIWTNVEELRLPRADLYFPVYYGAQRQRIVQFNELIEYIREATSKDEPIFTFPALAMVYFVSERSNPTRHDFFFGTNVSFEDHLDIIRILERAHVQTIIISNNPEDYFLNKSWEFTRLLRAYISHRYYLVRRIGPYDVMKRYPETQGSKEGSHAP